MGDYVYANISFGGLIQTCDDFDDICQAIVDECLRGELPVYSEINSNEDAKLWLLLAHLSKEKITLSSDNANYGLLGRMEDALSTAGLSWWRHSSRGGDFDAQEVYCGTNLEERELLLSNGEYAVKLSDIQRCLEGDDIRIALQDIVNYHSPILPQLEFSDEVKAQYAPELARLKVTGQAA